MFNFFKRNNNAESAAPKFAKQVNQKINSKKVALQFVLEELDAARQGNATALNFVNNSGFEESEYIGAMNNSFEEVDGKIIAKYELYGVIEGEYTAEGTLQMIEGDAVFVADKIY